MNNIKLFLIIATLLVCCSEKTSKITEDKTFGLISEKAKEETAREED